MSLNSRLKRLEAIAASKRQQQAKQSYQAAKARYAVMSNEELLGQYYTALNTTPVDPQLVSLDADQLIKHYFNLLS